MVGAVVVSPPSRSLAIGAVGLAEGRKGNSAAQRAAAARTVAAAAVDAAECAELLAMIGLDAQDGLSSVESAS